MVQKSMSEKERKFKVGDVVSPYGYDEFAIEDLIIDKDDVKYVLKRLKGNSTSTKKKAIKRVGIFDVESTANFVRKATPEELLFYVPKNG